MLRPFPGRPIETNQLSTFRTNLAAAAMPARAVYTGVSHHVGRQFMGITESHLYGADR